MKWPIIRDFQGNSFAHLCTQHARQSTHGVDMPAFATDHTADITGGYEQIYENRTAPGGFLDMHCLRVIYQGLGHVFDHILNGGHDYIRRFVCN